MKKWQEVKRLTPKQKGEILRRKPALFLRRYEDRTYRLLRKGNGGLSGHELRRCPYCGYIDIWHLKPLANSMACLKCRKVSEVV